MSGRGRGRGRKAVVAEDTNVVVDVAEAPTSTPVAAIEKPKRKSTKKQFTVVAVVTPNSIEGNLQPEIRKPLIAHLPIQSRDVIFHDQLVQYNPIPPTNVEPYDATLNDPFASTLNPDGPKKPDELQQDLQGQQLMQQQQQQQQQQQPIKPEPKLTEVQQQPEYYKKGTLLVPYQQTEELRKIPDRVDAACFWCCHTFDTKPVVLPIRDQGEYLQVYGNFCCPECAMAHLFDSRQDSFARWEQLSLLNRLYSEAVGGPIKPAPPRQILKLFGGPMGIDEYRGMIRSRKLRVDIHLPPMVSLLATMDTKPIDFYDVGLTRNVMETVKERLVKAEEVLKLKRTKPLKAWESTLDACINLRIRA